MIIRLDPGGPIDMAGLGASFAALARMYERQSGAASSEDDTPRLFISKLSNGSVIAEIVPYAVMMGQAVPYMQSAMVVAQFTNRVGKALKALAGEADPAKAAPPSAEDARDIKEFVKPLLARKGANLQIKHARFEKRAADAETVIEYRFEEQELNRAAITIDQLLEAPEVAVELAPPTTQNLSEVTLFFDQAGRGAGKLSGRTGDKAVVPSISPKPLPTYFKADADLKSQMVQGDANPLNDAMFVVDVEVQYVGGEPKGYLVEHLHRIVGQ